MSEDGHPVAGTVRFALTGSAPGGTGATSASSAAPAPEGSGAGTSTDAAPTPDAANDDGVPPWAFGIGGIVGVAAVGGAVWFGRRATRDLE